MKGQPVAAFGSPHPRRSLTGEGDLLADGGVVVPERNPKHVLVDCRAGLHLVCAIPATALNLDRQIEFQSC